MGLYVFLFTILMHLVFSVNCRVIQKTDEKSNSNAIVTTTEMTAYPSRERVTLVQAKNHQELNTTELCPDSKDHRCLVSALSRIARVRFLEDGSDTSSKVSQHQANWSPRFALHGGGKRFDTGRDISAKSKFESQQYRCHAVRDVYMPEAATKLPAYACKFEDKAFVLTSARFLEDRRSYVDVDLDLETFKRMNNVQKNLNGNQLQVVPAMLVLKVGENNYKIRIPERKLVEKKFRNVH